RETTVVWAVPLLKLAGDLLAAVAVGCLVAAAFFVDGDRDGRIRPRAFQWGRVGGWCAAGWAAVACAQLPVNYAEYLPAPLAEVTPGGLWSYVADTEYGLAYVLTVALALAAAVTALNSLTVSTTASAALIAVAAALPQVFVGHSASSGNHQIAVDSMIFHVLGVLAWTGGLVALLLTRKLGAEPARRYSALALVAFCVVAASGIVNAATRVYAFDELTRTAYGRELLAKAAALVVLGGFGLWHRRVTLPRLEARPARFRRFAAVEILVMAATFGLAVALSRTEPPEDPGVDDAGTSLLGFPTPGPISAKSVLLDWYPSVVFIALAATAIGLYLAGAIRLRRRGDAWPVTRTALWVGGWALAVLVTSSGLSKYSMVLFSAHMVQHMALNMLVPILLVLAAPATLALRALKPGKVRGPREWLTLALHSRVVKAISHPLVALALYSLSLYLVYFTGILEWALREHAGHLFMQLHFLTVGCLFYWVVVGPDPAPRPRPYPLRVLIFFFAVVFHTIFGLTIMNSAEVLAADWYSALPRDWGPSALADQKAGGGIAWAFGEPPSLILLVALVWQWSRSDERERRRLDRASERAVAEGRPEDDPHEQYNRYLAGLAEADRKAGLRD
ncbi:MAG: cytochrome c oxidase assembly protein, partial [Stackebrandtia sp.]